MAQQFAEEDRADLLERGFNNDQLEYLESLEMDAEQLYFDICHIMDDFGDTPEEIIESYNQANEEHGEDEANEEENEDEDDEDFNYPGAAAGGKRKNKSRRSRKTKKSRKSRKGKKTRKGKKSRKTRKRRTKRR